jgi:hypothetical protein
MRPGAPVNPNAPRPTIQPKGGSDPFVNDLRRRIDQYFDIVVRSIKDAVPKIIGFFLVKKSQESLQFELYNQINQNPAFTQALGEPKMITERRKALAEITSTLQNSLKVLTKETANL